MNTEQILKVLKNERECIKRQSGVEAPDGSVGICDRNCAKCDLCLPDTEILEVYDHLIKIVECEAIYIKCDVSEEEKREIFLQLQRAGFALHPDLIEKYGLKGDTDFRCTNCGGELDKYNYCKECGYKLYDVTTGNDIMRQYKSMPPLEDTI